MIAQKEKDKKILANQDKSVDEKLKHGMYYDEYKKFAVGSVQSSSSIMTVETNWNKEVNKNRFLKLKVGDSEIIVRNDHLREILKLIAPIEEWEQLASHSRRFYRTRRQVATIRATKNYIRGEEIWFAFDVPEPVIIS